jgi:hypothetical protein
MATADMKRRRRATPTELTDTERRALQQLAEADGVLHRWPVGRAVARSLRQRDYVVIFSEFVMLTDAGRDALAGGESRS